MQGNLTIDRLRSCCEHFNAKLFVTHDVECIACVYFGNTIVVEVFSDDTYNIAYAFGSFNFRYTMSSIMVLIAHPTVRNFLMFSRLSERKICIIASMH